MKNTSEAIKNKKKRLKRLYAEKESRIEKMREDDYLSAPVNMYGHCGYYHERDYEDAVSDLTEEIVKLENEIGEFESS